MAVRRPLVLVSGLKRELPVGDTLAWSTLSSTPTTLAGYGITDAEPAIAAGTTAQYRRGDKTWQDFGGAARGTVLTSYAVGANAALADTDTVLGAFGKVQAQLNNKSALGHTHAFADLTAKPTTLAGYGITDAIPLSGSTAITGALGTQGEVQSYSANSFRHVQGNYGTFWRNDGTNLYLLMTNSGDQYGSFNTLRPLTVNLASGAVTMSQGATISELTVLSRLDINNADGRKTHFNWNGASENYIRGRTEISSNVGIGMLGLPSAADSGLAINKGSLGDQTLHVSFHQGDGIRLWQQGVEADRAFQLWSYIDTGAYQGNPLKINRDAQTLLGASTGWTIAGSPVLTAASTTYNRLAGAASMDASDFNNMNQNGWWMYAGAANAPFGSTDWFMVDVRKHNDAWIQQTAYKFTGNAGGTRYYRHMNSGTWGAWTINQTFNSVYVGSWGANSAYDGVMATDTGTYLLMAGAATDTFVGARAGKSVRIRPDNNSVNAEFFVSGTGAYAAHSLHHISADGAAWIRVPRTFVQSADPGAQSADNDLWLW